MCQKYNIKKVVYSASASCYGVVKKFPTDEKNDTSYDSFFGSYFTGSFHIEPCAKEFLDIFLATNKIHMEYNGRVYVGNKMGFEFTTPGPRIFQINKGRGF